MRYKSKKTTGNYLNLAETRGPSENTGKENEEEIQKERRCL